MIMQIEDKDCKYLHDLTREPVGPVTDFLQSNY